MLRAILTAEEHAELDEGLQGHYQEAADGSFALNADVEKHPTVAGLRATLKKYRDVAPDAKALKKALDDAQELREAVGDRSAEDLSAAFARLEELEAGGKGDNSAEVERLSRRIEALTTAHKDALDKKDEEIRGRDAFIERLVLDQALDRSMTEEAEADSRGVHIIEDYRPAVKALIRQDFKPRVVREGEEYKGIISTDMGDESISDFMARWGRSDKAKKYRPASGNEGSGARNSDAPGGSATNPFKAETRNLTEQGRLVKENPTLAKRLAKEAGVELAGV